MTILYSGPITPAGQPSTGGFEAANRKNIDALRRRGVEVVELPYPIVNRKWGKLGKLAYAKLFLTPLKLLKYRGRKDVILHITPIYGNLLLPAVITIKAAGRMGLKVVTDVRAGSLITYYQSRGKNYRKGIREMLEGGDIITVEGSPYIGQIRDIIGVNRPTFHFPNLTSLSPEASLPQDKTRGNTINLFYFGRITRNKGIDLLLDMMKILPERFHLYLAGGIAPDIDRNALNDTPRTTYLGLLKPTDLTRHMQKMHIFVFPTRHVGEGQSNSLIEAMGEGLIPVTSRQGFCEEVVADCGTTLPPDATATDYAAAIEQIASGDLNAAALKCRRHILEHHNLDTEIDKLTTLYTNLLKRP